MFQNAKITYEAKWTIHLADLSFKQFKGSDGEKLEAVEFEFNKKIKILN